MLLRLSKINVVTIVALVSSECFGVQHFSSVEEKTKISSVNISNEGIVSKQIVNGKENFTEEHSKDNKLLGFLYSLIVATNELENAVYNSKIVLEEMVKTGKSLPKSEGAEQLKTASQDGRLLLKTLLHSGTKISESIATLPIETTLEAGNYLVDSMLESGLRLLTSDEAVQVKTSVGEGKDTVKTVTHSGKKVAKTVQSIPLQVLTGKSTVENTSVYEEVKQLQTTLGNGKSIVGNVTNTGMKLATSFMSLPLQTAVDVKSFAVDSLLEKAINLSKSDEAFLLNTVMVNGTYAAGNIVDAGLKLVGSITNVPLHMVSDINNIVVEAVRNTKAKLKEGEETI